MSKRFTDTEKWDRPWFRHLPNTYKLFWIYILDRCDAAGIWYVDMEMARFYLATKIDQNKAIELFQKQIETKVDRWLIKDFIGFQYGSLNPENKNFRGVSFKLEAFKEGASIPLLSPIQGGKDKEQERVKEDSVFERGVGKTSNFDAFWSAYPKKVGKGAAEKAWIKVGAASLNGQILQAVENQKRCDQWQKDGGQFIPNPATWLNQRRWEDEIAPNGISPEEAKKKREEGIRRQQYLDKIRAGEIQA
jgi:hypothetical protein